MRLHVMRFSDESSLVHFVNETSLPLEQIVTITQTLLGKDMRWVLFYYAE